MSRMVFLAGLLAVTCVAPVGAQDLGLWQDRVGEGITYGEPATAGPLSAVDPVRALPAVLPPAAARPVRLPASATPVAVKPAGNNALAAATTDGPVGNFLARPRDPDAPLPHPDIEGMQGQRRGWAGPHPYARGGQGGGSFGLSVPLPAERVSITTKNTRSGNVGNAPESGFGSR